QLLLDERPDDARHLVAVELDDRVGHLDLGHGRSLVGGRDAIARRAHGRRAVSPVPARLLVVAHAARAPPLPGARPRGATASARLVAPWPPSRSRRARAPRRTPPTRCSTRCRRWRGST